MSRQTFIHGADDMQWLFSTHCKSVSAELSTRLHSAVITGNEDSPEQVDIYWAEFPLVYEAPAVVMIQDDNGDLIEKVGF